MFKIEITDKTKGEMKSWGLFAAGLCGLIVAVRVTHKLCDIVLSD